MRACTWGLLPSTTEQGVQKYTHLITMPWTASPALQCADIFFLKADICQLGMDQRKVRSWGLCKLGEYQHVVCLGGSQGLCMCKASASWAWASARCVAVGLHPVLGSGY